MDDFHFYWSSGNEKLEKTAQAWERRFKIPARFLGFNIPRLRAKDGQVTCPYAGICADYCYAAQGRFVMPMAQSVREGNLHKLNTLSWDEIKSALCEDLKRYRTTTHVRIHDSGDFFSKNYYRTWLSVALQFPQIIFYAYTKSIPLIEWESHSKNFRLVQSIGGKRDKDIDETRPHSKVFTSVADRKRAGYCDGNISDMPAILGQIKIGLVYHGTKKLNEKSKMQLQILV